MALKLNCVEKLLTRSFHTYGQFVGKHPWPFLLVPLLFTAISLIGVIRFNPEFNTEYLYTPVNGQAKQDRQRIRQLFPENETRTFTPPRKLDLAGRIYILMKGKSDNQNIYTTKAMNLALAIDNMVQSHVSLYDGKEYTYTDVCSGLNGKCFENSFLELLGNDASTINQVNIKYPINGAAFLGMQLGGVQTNQMGDITTVEAITLAYHVQYLSKQKDAAKHWLEDIRKLVLKYNETDGIILFVATSHSLDDELQQTSFDVVPLFSITYTILCTFACWSCFMFDWVRNKTWVAFAGQMSAGLAICTTIGLLSAFAVPFASICAVMPFLVMGIGLDDMFVIVSAWRDTSIKLSSIERMGQTFQLAAVSITLTSVTDILAFCIGAISPFPAVQFFCAYTGVACLFCYLYSVTFFAACMAFSGRQEEQNIHAGTCRQVKPASQSTHRSGLYRFLCTGGDSPYSTVDKRQPLMTELIAKYYAPWLMKLPVKCLVMVLYVIYVGAAIWGCFYVREGLELKHLISDGSYLKGFYDWHDEYFLEHYSARTMIVIDEKLDYTDPTVVGKIDALVSTLKESKYYYNDTYLTELWLNDFRSYLKQNSLLVQNMTTFINQLRFRFPNFERFKPDIKFNDDFTAIDSSRFFVQAKGVHDSIEEKQQMLESRRIADESGLTAIAFFFDYVYFDQYTLILNNTLLILGVAVIAVFIVSLLLVPSLVAVAWVTISIVSICAGVVGFMAFWDVTLNAVSMINLVLCVGFSVDFSAHITYHFSASPHKCGSLKAIDSLTHLGTPVIQGALSTILGVIVLAASDSYIFRTFFKMIVLVTLFGFFHAMCVLPVILSSLYKICQHDQATPPLASANETVGLNDRHANKETPVDM